MVSRRTITSVATVAAVAVLLVNHVYWPGAFHGRGPAGTIIEFGELKITTGNPALDVLALALFVAGWVGGKYMDVLKARAR